MSSGVTLEDGESRVGLTRTHDTNNEIHKFSSHSAKTRQN